MIKIINVLEGTLYCLIFTFSIRVIDTSIDKEKYKPQSISKTSEIKNKILLVLSMVAFLVLLTYFFKCQGNEGEQIDFLQCIYIKPGQQLVRNVAIALFVNTTLFLGGLHQQLYNGGIRKKFMRFYKKQFQWNLFKKLFIVPLSVQIVFRAILCRVVDPHLQHPSFFVFFSGTLYALSHSINYFKFREKYDHVFALKATGIQLIYNFIFGLYLSHIFSRSSTLISSLICQVYGNFMGYPQYFQILKGDLYDDRVRKTTLFYLCGVIGCLSCCLFL